MKHSHNNILDIWKEDVSWNKMTKAEKRNSIAFALSFVSFLLFVQTWFVVPSLLSMAYFFDKIKNLKIKE